METEDSSGKEEGRNRGAPACIHDRRRWNLGQSLWQHTLCLGHSEHLRMCLAASSLASPDCAHFPTMALSLYESLFLVFAVSNYILFFTSPFFIVIIISSAVSHHSALDSTPSGPPIINSKMLNGLVASPSPRPDLLTSLDASGASRGDSVVCVDSEFLHRLTSRNEPDHS